MKIIPVNYANVYGYLLQSGDRVILVDAGHPKTVHKFTQTLESNGISPEQVKLIVLTHTHYDHAGGAAEIKQITGAKVAVHESEAENLSSGNTPFPKGTRWKGKAVVAFGKVFAPRLARYPATDPDILIKDKMDLSEFGISGEVRHTPGHTQGSVSVFLENGNVIGGDNIFGITDTKHFPPFANDRKALLESWQMYLDSGASTFYPAHGKKFPVTYIRDEIGPARKRYL